MSWCTHFTPISLTYKRKFSSSWCVPFSLPMFSLTESISDNDVRSFIFWSPFVLLSLLCSIPIAFCFVSALPWLWFIFFLNIIIIIPCDLTLISFLSPWQEESLFTGDGVPSPPLSLSLISFPSLSLYFVYYTQAALILTILTIHGAMFSFFPSLPISIWQVILLFCSHPSTDYFQLLSNKKGFSLLLLCLLSIIESIVLHSPHPSFTCNSFLSLSVMSDSFFPFSNRTWKSAFGYFSFFPSLFWLFSEKPNSDYHCLQVWSWITLMWFLLGCDCNPWGESLLSCHVFFFLSLTPPPVVHLGRLKNDSKRKGESNVENVMEKSTNNSRTVR